MEKGRLGDAARDAANSGLRSGLSGSLAMSAQITSFMWLHTVMRYQYRHGTTALDTARTLYRDGGLMRFYRGYPFAMLNAPLIRFGSTATNQASLTFLDSMDPEMPIWVKTLCASSGAAAWRVLFTPLDMMQTSLQVGGSSGRSDVGSKIRAHGPLVLWHGSSALYLSALIGHFSWFGVYNTLNRTWAEPVDPRTRAARDGAIGVLSTLVSDVSTNFLEVLKTQRQTTETSTRYLAAMSALVASDGLVGFLTRGLKTRLFINCVQGAFFTIVWNTVQRRMCSTTLPEAAPPAPP